MRQPHQTGKLAEWICILRLWLSAWRILAIRWRCPSGEIDLIASRGKLVTFIEVKARKSHDDAIASISATQQQRITRAASLWVAKNPQYAGHDLRFDVMSVSIWPWPKRHANAF
ncbi:MAG: YraN family protein [Rickettsiales bacterium]|nr:YraN family protein [Rickettsiales bacterium]